MSIATNLTTPLLCITILYRWESLKAQASSRRGTLEEALGRAKDFNDHWKTLVDWLADAERRAYTDWRPCALPETCQADITKHQVRGHQVLVILRVAVD